MSLSHGEEAANINVCDQDTDVSRKGGYKRTEATDQRSMGKLYHFSAEEADMS